MSMHAVAIVHHNKLANRLGLINPHWSDERIFQVYDLKNYNKLLIDLI